MMLFEIMNLIEEIEPKFLEKVIKKVSEIDKMILEKRKELDICDNFQREELEKEYEILCIKLKKWLEIENAMVDNVHPF